MKVLLKLTVFAAMIAFAMTLAACGGGNSSGGEGSSFATDGANSESTSAESSQPGDSEAASVDYTTGTPWLDSDLDGNVTEDTEASLKDHFVLAVNKDKLLTLQIPDGFSNAGTTTNVNLKNDEDNRKMYLGDAPAEHDPKLAYDLFWLMMDWDSRNAQGVAPLKEITDTIDKIDSAAALKAYCLDVPEGQSLAKLWKTYTIDDLKDSTKKTITVDGCELILGDSAEYSSLTESGTTKKEAATNLALKMLKKLGYSDDEAQKKVDSCFAFEAEIAPAIPTAVEQKSPDYAAKASNNYFGYDELKQMEGGVPLLERAEKDGYPKSDSYLVENPDFLKKLDELMTDDHVAEMRDYLIVHSAIAAAGDLDRECYDWNTEYNNKLKGATGTLADEDAFSRAVNDKLPWPAARLYSDTNLKPEDKERLTEITDKIMNEYHGMIQDADFISDETKAKALEKLEAMNKGVYYPDDWSLYSCEDLNFASKDDGGKLWDALETIRAYDLAQQAKECSEPVSREKWSMTPNTVNCSFSQRKNTMYICGAQCADAYYSSDMSDEEIYAGIGMVIAHEISHAFDSEGAQFDKDGNMTNWWTDEDLATFQKRNEKLAAYYDNIHPWEGIVLDGKGKTSEAGADMAGMKTILRIAAKTDGFDYDKFFRSFANVLMEKGTLEDQLFTFSDKHPASYLRANCTMQQFDEFLNLYDIKEGDGMYLAPEDRVCVW